MMDRSCTFSPEELPDGSFIVHHRAATKAQLSINAGEQAVVRPAEYIGSFTVKGTDYKERTEFVHRKLESMRIVTRSKPILMVISLSGVKVCSESGDSVFMAHALKRISYATCTPEYCQFSFLAREPNSHLRSSDSTNDSNCASVQHCHSFITQAPEQAEELNNIIGDAFKMAYALRRRQKTPTFNEVIERQLQQQQQHHHHQSQQMPIQPIQSSQQMPYQQQQYQLQLRDFGVVPSKDEQGCECGQPPQFQQQQSQGQQQNDNVKAYPRQNTASSLNSEIINQKPTNESNDKPPSYGKSQTKHSEQNQQPNRQRQLSSSQSTAAQPPLQSQQSPPQSETTVSGQASSWGRQQQQTPQQQPPAGNKAYGSPVVAFKERMDAQPAQSPSQQQAASQEYQLQQFSQQPYPRQESDESRRHRPLPPPPTADCPLEEEPVRQAASRTVVPVLSEEAPMGPLSTSALQQQTSAQQQQHTPPPPIPTRFNSLHKYDQQPTSTVGSGNSGSSGGGQRGVGNSAPSSEEEWLSRVPWYMPSIPREIALELLAQEEEGSFVVRDSVSHPGCYALSVKVPVFYSPSRISHYLIQRTQRGVKLKGLEKEWPNLQSLVVHLTVMQEMLPCTLRLPRAAQNPAFRPGVDGMEEEEEDEEEDLDYQRLSDFTSMMAELRQLQQA